MRRLRNGLFLLVGAVFTLTLIALGAAAILALSEGGTRFLFSQAERFLPMTASGVTGTLADRFSVAELRYELEDQSIEISGLEMAFDLWTLLTTDRLDVHALSARRVRLLETQPAVDPAPTALEFPALPIEITVQRATLEVIELPATSPLALTVTDARINARQLRVGFADLASEKFRVTLHGTLRNARNPTLQTTLQWSLPDVGWSGEGTLAGPVHSVEVRQTITGDYTFDAQGRADLTIPANPNVDLNVVMSDMALDPVNVRSIVGRLRGDLSLLELDASATLETPWLAPVAVHARAKGPPTGPLTYVARGDPLSGSLDVQGHLDWREELEWVMNGRAADLQLEPLHADLSGSVSTDLALKLTGGHLQGTLRDLSGTLHGRPIQGALSAVQTDAGWSVDEVQLRVGANRLAARGALLAEVLNVDASVDAPTLGELGFPLTGDLTGTIEVSGPLSALTGKAAITSAALEGFGAELGGLKAEIASASGKLRANATADHSNVQDLEFVDVQTSLEGPWNDFSWKIRWREGSLEGHSRIVTQTNTATLSLHQATVAALDQQLTLEAPTTATLSPTTIHVEPFCITSQGSRACVHELAQYDAQNLTTRGTLESLPMKLFANWLPLNLRHGAFLEGAWSVKQANGQWSGDLSIAARKLAIALVTDEASADAVSDDSTIELPDLIVTGVFTDDRLSVDGQFQDEAFGIGAQGTIMPISLDGALTGEVAVSASDLDALRAFDQRIREVAGKIDGRLWLSGTLRSPTARGALSLTDGDLQIQNPDLHLQALELALELNEGGRFTLAGSARQDEAPLSLEGSGTRLFSADRRLETRIYGTGLQAEHPSWNITVSPDLRFSYAESRGHVSGKVTIPEAKVRLNVLPTSAPRVSSDVRVLGREADQAETLRITADVTVVLGDAVQLKAVGVTAELAGELRARRDARERTTLHGTLNVAGGVLSAQGQSLAIESGVVRYDGPVEDPYLDIRAARTIDTQTPTVKVGVHIRGRADNLISTIFSEPPMSDTRALSFLILGRDFDESSDQDGSMLMSAAINLGLRSSKSIVSDVRNLVGLDELSAMAESQESFAIVAGKRIGPRLYVRYTYDTLAALGALLVRYDLAKRWHLEAQSGESSAMDLFYAIEK